MLPERMSRTIQTRREFVIAMGGVAVAAGLPACQGQKGAENAGGSGAGGGDGATCQVYPQQTEGPFYLDLDTLRADITEGRPGLPLELELSILGATCEPLANATVDVWHCDVDGIYSGYPGQLGGLDTSGQKFFRGSQVTGTDGKVTFRTVYPGWYPGRTTHIHFKVHPTSTTEATSQMYFPEDVTAEVYASAPYVAHGQKDTTNTSDGVNQGHVPPLLSLEKTANGYRGTLTIVVAT